MNRRYREYDDDFAVDDALAAAREEFEVPVAVGAGWRRIST
ncbi:MAG: hypothetical protein U0W40_12040 [Acidimicrobiia bacterium]